MEVRAVTKFVRVQPRKVRIVADEVRGKPAIYTAHLLRFHRSKAAFHLRKTLISAISNAINNHGLPGEELKITRIMIDEGPRMKRIEQRAMGRAYRILKKTSHITVIVDQSEGEMEVRPHGTKPKPRPKFAAPKKATAKKAKETLDAATAAEPEEATPVTAADAPEEAGSATEVAAEPEAVHETTPEAEGATVEEDKEKE